MNFSNHVKNLRKKLRKCLSGDKKQILTQLNLCLEEGNSLLNSSKIDFWLKQFEIVDIPDIPLTKFGLQETKEILAENPERSENSREKLIYELLATSENLMTYTVEDDVCELQSQYHWYYLPLKNKAFKLSELGITNLENINEVENFRIAKISEIDTVTDQLMTEENI